MDNPDPPGEIGVGDKCGWNHKQKQSQRAQTFIGAKHHGDSARKARQRWQAIAKWMLNEVHGFPYIFEWRQIPQTYCSRSLKHTEKKMRPTSAANGLKNFIKTGLPLILPPSGKL